MQHNFLMSHTDKTQGKWGQAGERERAEGRGETWGVITMNVICLSCRPFILAAEVEQELPQCRGSKSQPNGRRLQFKGRGGARSKQGVQGVRKGEQGRQLSSSSISGCGKLVFLLLSTLFFFSVAHCCSKNIDGHVVSCLAKQRGRERAGERGAAAEKRRGVCQVRRQNWQHLRAAAQLQHFNPLVDTVKRERDRWKKAKSRDNFWFEIFCFFFLLSTTYSYLSLSSSLWADKFQVTYLTFMNESRARRNVT